jgi:hypothetical protein
VPPLTDNVKYIDSGQRFSFPQQVHPVPLDVLSSPLSSCLQKQEIVQNDPANPSSSCCQCWRCCHPKARSVCQPDGSLIFHGLLPMQTFSGRNRISIAYGRMANSIFLRGSKRKRVWILAYCQSIPPPPPKG